MRELRQFPRVHCEIESSFRNLDDPIRPATVETTVHNISEGGVRFRTDKFVALSNRLFLTINLPKQRPISVRVQPAWISENPTFSAYEVGARFVDLSSEDRSLIRQIIQNGAAD